DEVFLAPRPIFQRLRETEKESWSKSAAELAQALQKPGGAYWNYAIGLYHRATGILGGSEAKARGPQRSVHGRLPSLLRRVHFERPPATAGAQEDRIHGRTADIRSLVQGILRTALSQLSRQEMK